MSRDNDSKPLGEAVAFGSSSSRRSARRSKDIANSINASLARLVLAAPEAQDGGTRSPSPEKSPSSGVAIVSGPPPTPPPPEPLDARPQHLPPPQHAAASSSSPSTAQAAPRQAGESPPRRATAQVVLPLPEAAGGERWDEPSQAEPGPALPALRSPGASLLHTSRPIGTPSGASSPKHSVLGGGGGAGGLAAARASGARGQLQPQASASGGGGVSSSPSSFSVPPGIGAGPGFPSSRLQPPQQQLAQPSGSGGGASPGRGPSQGAVQGSPPSPSLPSQQALQGGEEAQVRLVTGVDWLSRLHHQRAAKQHECQQAAAGGRQRVAAVAAAPTHDAASADVMLRSLAGGLEQAHAAAHAHIHHAQAATRQGHSRDASPARSGSAPSSPPRALPPLAEARGSAGGGQQQQQVSSGSPSRLRPSPSPQPRASPQRPARPTAAVAVPVSPRGRAHAPPPPPAVASAFLAPPGAFRLRETAQPGEGAVWAARAAALDVMTRAQEEAVPATIVGHGGVRYGRVGGRKH